MPSLLSYDLVVVGAGPAGFTAALAARKAGLKKVLLLEEKLFPGGSVSAAGVNSMLTFHGLKGHKIIGGIPQFVIDKMSACGLSAGHVRDTVGVAKSVTPVSVSGYSMIIAELCKEYEVDFLTGCKVTGVVNKPIENAKRISSLRAERNGELIEIAAILIVDASGGIVSEMAGAQLLPLKENHRMPLTLIFSVGGVDLSKVKQYMKENPLEFHHETLWDEVDSAVCLGVSGFFTLWKEAELSIPRDRILFYQTLGKDEVAVNSTRVFVKGDPASSDLYGEAFEQVSEIFRFMKKSLPGFKNSYITNIAPFIGIREYRRVRGNYVLTGKDAYEGRRFSDEIAFSGFPVDIHSSRDKGLISINLGGDGFFGIPYRCIVSTSIPNLFIPGKCLSSEFEAHASARVQATSMAMGEACGMAAAISLEKRIMPGEVDVNLLRMRLSQNDVILEPEMDDSL